MGTSSFDIMEFPLDSLEETNAKKKIELYHKTGSDILRAVSVPGVGGNGIQIYTPGDEPKFVCAVGSRLFFRSLSDSLKKKFLIEISI